MDHKLYKYSQFNIIIKEKNDKVLIFNTKSMKAIYLDKEEQGLIINRNDIDPLDIRQKFIDIGFVVPANEDETYEIIERSHYVSHNHPIMNLVIGTTMQCNYNCNYCFQHDNLNKSSHMTIGIADALFGFVQKELEANKHIKKVHIRWFGGETLLNPGIMDYIVDKFISNSIDFDGEIYSNCRLLTEDKYQILKKCNIRKIDVTLDGLPETYAKIKGCKIEDFEKTIYNLQTIQDTIETVDIKINVSEENKDEAFQLAKSLYKDYGLHGNIRFRPVIEYDDIHMKAKYAIQYSDYIELVVKLIKWQKDNGYNVSIGAYSKRKACTCIASGVHNYVIDNKGIIYRCTHFHGSDNYAVGNVKIGLTHTDYDNIFIDNDIPSRCLKCSVLPICMGGCIMQREIYHMQFDCDNIITEVKKSVQSMSVVE